jgi:hypothetical protein
MWLALPVATGAALVFFTGTAQTRADLELPWISTILHSPSRPARANLTRAFLLTTPQLAFLDLPSRRAGHVAGALLSRFFAGSLATFQGPQTTSQ